jgi:hypothetical protein
MNRSLEDDEKWIDENVFNLGLKVMANFGELKRVKVVYTFIV